MAWGTDQAHALASCSPAGVDIAASRVKARLAGPSMWVPDGSAYYPDLAERVKAKGVHAPSASESVEISDFLAAGAIHHPSDGWNYLYHALVAWSRGSPGTAIH